MAHLRCDFHSEVLGLSTTMTVILPEPTTTQIGMSGRVSDDPPPVLYLLHGLSDDDTTWLRRTSIERYVADLGLAVVMPQVHRSFYSDEVYGNLYWTFLSDELPDLVGRFFRVSQRREDTFVAGLSMGGYGAWKWALTHPDRFAAAASLSGALAIADRPKWERRGDPMLMTRVFGNDDVTAGPADIRWLLAQHPPAELPALYLGCGTEDIVYRDTLMARDECRRLGIDVTVDIGPGAHEWGYWDEQIQHVLDWLFVPGRPGSGLGRTGSGDQPVRR